MKKEPRNKEQVLEFVNTIRKEIGKKPLKKMPVTWGRRIKVVIEDNSLMPKVKYRQRDYSYCPIERAITGAKNDGDSCPISVDSCTLTAKKGTNIDKAFAKHLSLNKYYDQGEDYEDNYYDAPAYCSEFIYDVDDLALGSTW